MMTIRIESQPRGSHVHAIVRVGERPGVLTLSGVLVLPVGEWQALLAALAIGQRAMEGHVMLELPGQDAVCAAFGAERAARESGLAQAGD